MKRYIAAANWKMNKDVPESREFVKELLKKLLNIKDAEVILCPPFTSLFSIGELLKKSKVRLGAQNMHFADSGAFTGEISAGMLKSVYCEYVILGHSERRHVFGETDEDIHKKLLKALEKELKPILCVGETLEERQSGRTIDVLKQQYRAAFDGLSDNDMRRCAIAYEPVWAIGTGVVATPEQASEAHREIRQLIARQFSGDLAQEMRILYGGSVKPENADELIATDEIDGFLVGGAGLKVDSFASIVQSVDNYLQAQE
ncbi:MAG: triose-phosphate isomerase [Candidatus Marinimicrobia bacterium]|nr:triose-phosphate isomerase [Candidatus Neomarinimicrobiota bacterium]RKY61684.1 MAG: triose-phosphate isomerase [Candidatus Neomarinimicrobiota bacterium]